jgi:hypothetical protein
MGLWPVLVSQRAPIGCGSSLHAPPTSKKHTETNATDLGRRLDLIHIVYKNALQPWTRYYDGCCGYARYVGAVFV